MYIVDSYCYDVKNLAQWLGEMKTEVVDYMNTDPMRRHEFTTAQRADIFKAVGRDDPRPGVLFLELSDLVMSENAEAFENRLKAMTDDTRDAVLRHAFKPGGITMLMFTAVELQPECMRVVLGHCSDPAYVNAVDAMGHTALASLFYWYMSHSWEWGEKAASVAFILLDVPGVDIDGALRVLTGMRGDTLEVGNIKTVNTWCDVLTSHKSKTALKI